MHVYSGAVGGGRDSNAMNAKGQNKPVCVWERGKTLCGFGSIVDN